MSMILENETDFEIDEHHIKLMQTLIESTLDETQCPYEAEVSVTIVTNEEIRELNREYREIDKETDVLSFPLLDYKTPADFSTFDEKEDDYFNFDTGELMLGDIVISYEKAMEQADDYNHSIERELGFLIVHSMLHLLGYDHMLPEDEQIMLELQEKILENAGLKR